MIFRLGYIRAHGGKLELVRDPDPRRVLRPFELCMSAAGRARREASPGLARQFSWAGSRKIVLGPRRRSVKSCFAFSLRMNSRKAPILASIAAFALIGLCPAFGQSVTPPTANEEIKEERSVAKPRPSASAERAGDNAIVTLSPFEVTMDGLVRPDYDWSPEHMTYVEDYAWSVVRA